MLFSYCSGNQGVKPGDERVPGNHYELENEDSPGGDSAYDTVNNAGASSSKKKPSKETLPPVYAQVDKENREGKPVREDVIN